MPTSVMFISDIKKSCMTYLFDGHNDLEENQFQVKQKMFKL